MHTTGIENEDEKEAKVVKKYSKPLTKFLYLFYWCVHTKRLIVEKIKMKLMYRLNCW